jgi:hypothetical protein
MRDLPGVARFSGFKQPKADALSLVALLNGQDLADALVEQAEEENKQYPSPSERTKRIDRLNSEIDSLRYTEEVLVFREHAIRTLDTQPRYIFGVRVKQKQESKPEIKKPAKQKVA